VVAEDGRTVVLGGLISNSVQETITKVPLLGDIPLLGWLFKSRNYTQRKTNLLVFITPHILNDGDDLEKMTQRSRQAMDQFRNSEVDFDLPVEDLSAAVIVPEPATEPAVTEPAVTEPAVTEPAVTEPAATEPAATEPAPATTTPAAE